MNDVRSVSLGFFLKTGSRDEEPDQAGLSHFMEHMTFKGTQTRDAFQINREFDAMGAEQNAFTGKESTCFYARCVDEQLPEAFEIMADMLVDSLYANEAIDSERNVVLEEIARSYDAPDDYVFDLSTKTLMPDHPLGNPVLGDRDLVADFDHDDCLCYRDQHYIAENLCVAASGHIDHDRLVALCQSNLGSLRRGLATNRQAERAVPRDAVVSETRDTQQANIVLGVPWMSALDQDRYAGYLLTQVLGGSMSSRLFEEIREKRGLAYATYASPLSYSDTGMLVIYVGTRPENVGEAVRIAHRELEKIARDGVTEEELARVAKGVSGQVLLGEESTISRMLRLGRAQTMGNDLISTDDLVKRYRSVTLDDVQKVVQGYLVATPTVALISPLLADEAQSTVRDALKDD